jgi:hypothetical protein
MRAAARGDAPSRIPVGIWTAAFATLAILASPAALLAADDAAAASQAAPDPVAGACAHYWCRLPQAGAGYLALGYVNREGSEGADDLTGMRLEWGGWLETPYHAGFKPPRPKALGVHYWLSETKNDVQQVWTTGFAGDLTFFSWGPVRVFPRLHLGATYRTEGPHPGWGIVSGAGLGTGVHVGPRSQIVFAVDYDFDSAAPNGFRSLVGVRFLDRRIPFPVME